MKSGWFCALLVWLGLAGSAHAFTLLSWNVGGNGAPDWSTNAAQVQAIGRILSWLRPDVITLQEIPFDQTHQMPHWVRAWLPGYALATNSGTDGYLRSVVVSRFPVRRSASWLDGAALGDWGYEGRFTRDLFEAEVLLPGSAHPLHVFTTHLKSGGDTDSAARRAAEASAISNWFVAVFLPARPDRPYVLTGDLNEDIRRPPRTSRQPIQRLANPATGLHLTTPANPFTGDERTFSTRTGLTVRYDYILPCGTLFSNLVTSQVFRTSLVTPLPGSLRVSDEREASDHLPVLMQFGGPFSGELRVRMATREMGWLELSWPAVPAGRYRVESSADLKHWQTAASELVSVGAVLNWPLRPQGPWDFFRVVWSP
jgi:endonuclease/exonuclease/phosphatase family metal-dependent hydrolase